MTLRGGAFLLAVSLLVVGACGSRESGPPPGGVEAEGATSPRGRSGPNAAVSSASVGTLEAACGKRRPAHGATDKGVTNATIKIGVISDKSGVIAVPTAGIDGSVEAFVQF
jgi:hypothetical protein